MTRTRTRLDTAERKRQILHAAVATAKKKKLFSMTRQDVAAAADCSAPLVRFYFKSMDELRAAVLAEAIRTSELGIVAQGIAMGHPRCRRIAPELRAAAIAGL